MRYEKSTIQVDPPSPFAQLVHAITRLGGRIEVVPAGLAVTVRSDHEGEMNEAIDAYERHLAVWSVK